MKLIPLALFMVGSICLAGLSASLGLDTVASLLRESLYWFGR